MSTSTNFPDPDLRLSERYPLLIGSMSVECGPGWFPLIDALCNALNNSVLLHGGPPPHVLQIKEKFGKLRFYARDVNDYQHGLIDMACALSSRICEQCGQPGVLMVSGGYFHTACDAHRRPEAITPESYAQFMADRRQQILARHTTSR